METVNLVISGVCVTTVPQLRLSRGSGNPVILVRSLINHLLDTRFRGYDLPSVL